MIKTWQTRRGELFQLYKEYSRGDQKPPKFIYKKLCIITYLNFSHLCNTLHLMQYTYQNFSTAQNSVWIWWFQWLLVLLPFFFFFCFTSSTLAKRFPFEDFFHLGKQKEVAWDEIKWIGRVGHRGQPVLVINWTLGAVWAGALINHSSRNGQTLWKSLQKKCAEAKCRLSHHHQLVHWYRWVPRTLT